MAKIYLKLILAGRKNFDEVPADYKTAVENLLREKAARGDAVAKQILEEVTKNG